MSNETTNVGLHTVSFGTEPEQAKVTDNGERNIEPADVKDILLREGEVVTSIVNNREEDYPKYRDGVAKKERARQAAEQAQKTRQAAETER